MNLEPKFKTQINLELLKEFKGSDLGDLCDVTEATLTEDSLSFSINLNRSRLPTREQIQSYWRGVLMVPERELVVARLDGTIAASLQLLKPAPSNQTTFFSATIDHHVVAPWARGHGLAKELMIFVEQRAKQAGLTVLKLSVRANLLPAIKLYESMGYKKWGTLDKYEIVGGTMLSGYFYYKEI